MFADKYPSIFSRQMETIVNTVKPLLTFHFTDGGRLTEIKNNRRTVIEPPYRGCPFNRGQLNRGLTVYTKASWNI